MLGIYVELTLVKVICGRQLIWRRKIIISVAGGEPHIQQKARLFLFFSFVLKRFSFFVEYGRAIFSIYWWTFFLGMKYCIVRTKQALGKVLVPDLGISTTLRGVNSNVFTLLALILGKNGFWISMGRFSNSSNWNQIQNLFGRSVSGFILAILQCDLAILQCDLAIRHCDFTIP